MYSSWNGSANRTFTTWIDHNAPNIGQKQESCSIQHSECPSSSTLLAECLKLPMILRVYKAMWETQFYINYQGTWKELPVVVLGCRLIVKYTHMYLSWLWTFKAVCYIFHFRFQVKLTSKMSSASCETLESPIIFTFLPPPPVQI